MTKLLIYCIIRTGKSKTRRNEVVQEIKSYLFRCEACGKVHQSASHDVAEGAALECERSGIALPEFRTFDVVHVNSGAGETSRGIVMRIVHWDNAHLLPGVYIVSFGKHNLREVLRGNMKPANIVPGKDGALTCPICSWDNIVGAKFKDYHPYSNAGHVGLAAYPRMHPLIIHSVDLSHCKTCFSSFFTSKQSKSVLREIRKIFKGINMPIANRASLIRHNRFAH